MSQFYGTLKGQSRTRATRRGGKMSGITTQAASWAGGVEVYVYADEQGTERYRVSLIPWQGRGPAREICSGILGEEVAP